eukprot:m.470638 g.470638  ORF g.470638 m.470638 type:complete len:60 (+) comp30035_c0_seq1:454-633(+)
MPLTPTVTDSGVSPYPTTVLVAVFLSLTPLTRSGLTIDLRNSKLGFTQQPLDCVMRLPS